MIHVCAQRCSGLPLHERTNVSPVSKKSLSVPSPCEVVVAIEKYDCDAERLRSSERFSRSITPRGRRQARRRRVHRVPDTDQNSSKVGMAIKFFARNVELLILQVIYNIYNAKVLIILKIKLIPT